MKTHYLKVLGLVLCLSASFSSLHAQVKIGNNPQTINAASLLELESSDKAFVIPRMNTVQMNSIVPLEGAIIYNTEAQCLHYFDGLVWINICEAFGNSITFSSESLENPGNFETITITQTTPTNFNFEVGILNASNIQDGSIISPKITDGAVTLNKLATNSVDNSKILNRTIQAGKLAPGLPNQVLQTNVTGTAALWSNLNANSISGDNLTAGDGSIVVTNGVGATLLNTNIRVTDLGITTLKLADDAVDNSKLADNAVQTENIVDATIVEADLADDAVTNSKISNDAISTLKLQDDAVTLTKIGTAVGDENKILGTDNAGNPEWQDAAQIASSLGEDVTSTNGSITGVAPDAALVAMNLEVKVDDVSLEVNPDTTTGLQIKDAGVTTDKIDAAAVDNSKLADDAVTLTKIGTAVGDENKILGTDNIGNPEWQDAAQIAASLGENVSSTNGSITGIADDAALVAMNLEVKVDDVSLEVNPDTTTGLQIKDAGVTTDKIDADAVTTNKIADLTITNEDIADRTIAPIKLADGVFDGDILRWNGTDWVLANESALSITEADGIIGNEITNVANTTLLRTGTGTTADPFLVAISAGGVSENELADEAVTSFKIADLTISNEDIADRTIAPIKLADGVADGDILRWNGTNWVLANESALSITEADGIIGNEVTDATDGTLTRSGTGVSGDEYTLGVSTNGITANEIANDAVTPLKIDATLAGAGLLRDAAGVISVNEATIAPVFSNITGVPADLADGDNDTTYSPGTGLSLTGTTFVVDNTTIAPVFSNITGVPADLADGDDDTTYAPGTGLSLTGTTFAVDNTTIAPVFSNITSIPSGLADGDDDTTYAPGTGLSLTGTTFAVDNTTIAPIFSNITGVPADLADGDDDTTYAPGDAMTLVGTVFSIADGDITTNKIANGTIVDADISSSAAILGTKINPNFGNLPVSTTNTISSGNNTITGTLSTTGTATIGANTITNINGSNGQVLTTDGAGNATWISLPTDANTTYTNGEALSLSGTNVFSVTDNTITSTKITNATIVDVDVAGNAAIAGSKINPIFTSDISTTGTVTIGAYSLLNTDGTNGQILSTDGAGTTNWINNLAPVVAGKIAATGITPLKNFNITSVNHTAGTGVYTINFNDLGNSDYIINTSLEGNTSNTFINITNQTNTSFTIVIKEIIITPQTFPVNGGSGGTVNIPVTNSNNIDKIWHFTITDF